MIGAELAVGSGDRALDVAEAVAASIASRGGRSLALRADVKNCVRAGEIVRRVEDRFGAADALINNPGIPGPNDKVAEIDDAAWRGVIDINLSGAFRAAKAVLPGMISRA